MTFMKVAAMILPLFLLSVTAKAQYNETIRTGRPGQAIGPYGVGKFVFQVQSGIDVGGSNDPSNEKSSTAFAPNTVLRYGLAKHFEINAAYEYRAENYKQSDSTYTTSGLSLNSIGTRINLHVGKGKGPSIGLQLSLKLPTLSPAYNPAYIAPKVLLIASQQITNKLSLLVNMGVNYSGNDAVPTGVYVANLGYAITPKWGAFVENYGSLTSSIFENRWDGGFAYMANDNLQFDIYGGAGHNHNITDYFVSAGISWRIRTWKN